MTTSKILNKLPLAALFAGLLYLIILFSGSPIIVDATGGATFVGVDEEGEPIIILSPQEIAEGRARDEGFYIFNQSYGGESELLEVYVTNEGVFLYAIINEQGELIAHYTVEQLEACMTQLEVGSVCFVEIEPTREIVHYVVSSDPREDNVSIAFIVFPEAQTDAMIEQINTLQNFNN